MSRKANNLPEAWYWVWQQNRMAKYLKGTNPGDAAESYMRQEHGDLNETVYIVGEGEPSARYFAMVDTP